MHIAHFSNTYHPVISGVVRSVSAFRQALTELGNLVFVFTHDAPDYEDQEPFIFRYPTLKLPLPGEFPATIPLSPFVDKLLPSLKLDVIHSHHPFLLGQAAASKAEALGVPLVYTYHTRYREYTHYVAANQEFIQEIVKDFLESWLRDYMRRCQHIVVPSESTRDMLAHTYGISDCVSVVPTGIDLTPYHNANGRSVRQERAWGEDRVLISIGRLAKEKNWETLLAAFNRVLEAHADARLVILGDGDERAALTAYTREAGIADRVEFAGRVSFEEVPAYLKAADLFCFPSVTETQGLVTAEALAAHLPVVAVDGPGTRDVVEHGQEGLLTENDSAGMAQAIVQLLDDEDLFARCRRAAAAKAPSLSIEARAQELLQVYEAAREAKRANRFVLVERDA